MTTDITTPTKKVTTYLHQIVLGFFYLEFFLSRLNRKLYKKLIRLKLAQRQKILQPDIGDVFIPPGVESTVFNGFVSSKQNSQGMQATFHLDKNNGVACQWTCKKTFEGYPKTLHGGVSFALLDELLAYAVFQRYASYAVTLSSNIRWKSSIAIDSTIKAKAQVVSKLGRLIKVEGWIFKSSGKIAVEISSIMYIPSKREFASLVDLSTMPKESIPYCGMG